MNQVLGDWMWFVWGRSLIGASRRETRFSLRRFGRSTRSFIDFANSDCAQLSENGEAGCDTILDTYLSDQSTPKRSAGPSEKLSVADTEVRSRQNRTRHLSPLRYPGGKAALSGFLAETIKINDLVGCSYYEPFAGGAGAALKLLAVGVVSEVHLNDLDPRIFAFWKAALNETDRFIEAILSVPVSVDEWHRQREICRAASASKPFELGFATFFLNRCNRSGVISGAAPIGGYHQSGNWKIDARFNRTRLADRIRGIADPRRTDSLNRDGCLLFLDEAFAAGRTPRAVFRVS